MPSRRSIRMVVYLFAYSSNFAMIVPPLLLLLQHAREEAQAALFHLLRWDELGARERAEAMITLAMEQGFPYWLAFGTIVRGWMLTKQGQMEEGITQIRQGIAAYRATGAGVHLPHFLALLAEAHGKAGQAEEGLAVLAEALTLVNKTDERFYEAEIHRLKGELLLAQARQQASGNEEQ